MLCDYDLINGFHRMVERLENNQIALQAKNHVDEDKLAMMFSKMIQVRIFTEDFLASATRLGCTVWTVGFPMTTAFNSAFFTYRNVHIFMQKAKCAHWHAISTRTNFTKTTRKMTTFTNSGIAVRTYPRRQGGFTNTTELHGFLIWPRPKRVVKYWARKDGNLIKKLGMHRSRNLIESL